MEPEELNVKGKSDPDNLLSFTINILAHFHSISALSKREYISRAATHYNVDVLEMNVSFKSLYNKDNYLMNSHYLEKHCFHLHNSKVES